MPRLFLTRRAKRDLTDLPHSIQQAILETLGDLEASPETEGKELRGRLSGLWSCRVGSYRVLYTIEGRGTKLRVIVRAIKHRGKAYRPRRGGR